MLLCFDGLAEDGFAARILLFHGARGVFHIVKHARLYGSGMGDHRAGFDVHFQQRAAARTGDFEVWGMLRHTANHTAKLGRTRLALEFDGEDVEDSEQLPAQQKNGKQNDENRHQFPEGQSAAIRFETPRG
jgi:hypothetical protein